MLSTQTATQRHPGFLRSLFRKYELIYVVADERDVIRVRTNYRQPRSRRDSVARTIHLAGIPTMRHSLPAVLLSIVGLLVAGCSVAGTTAIRNGRAAYNQAMVDTNNEQLLAMIVRMRYQEPYGLLAVASITANVRIQTSIGAQFGVGPQSNYAGNLVPLSAGALYEENPTISYVPVEGQQYLRQMLSPLPLNFAVLLLSALGDSPRTMTLLIKEINGIRNPEFVIDPSAAADDRFAQVAELLASLHRRGSMTWTQEPGDTPAFALLLRGEGADYAQEVARLHELLEIGRASCRERV